MCTIPFWCQRFSMSHMPAWAFSNTTLIMYFVLNVRIQYCSDINEVFAYWTHRERIFCCETLRRQKKVSFNQVFFTANCPTAKNPRTWTHICLQECLVIQHWSYFSEHFFVVLMSIKYWTHICLHDGLVIEHWLCFSEHFLFVLMSIKC